MDALGIDAAAVSDWLAEHVEGARPPFEFNLVPAGGSNLTYLVTDATNTVRVLRRPPVGTALPTAHDMKREWTVISALHQHGAVPVPAPLAECGDGDVTGTGFYVMGFVDGLILRDQAAAAVLDQQAADTATQALIDVQVAMHTLDLADAGLSDLGRHDDYTGRQLKRWKAQVERVDVRPQPLIHELHAHLSSTQPTEQAKPGLVHGDYRFDNVILGADHEIAAVLDWELTTIGDPLADFAWSIRYWAEPGDEFTWLNDPPTLHPAFGNRASVVERYAAATGFDLGDLGWYEIFSWWKQACIVEGVYARRLAGMTGGLDTGGAEAIAQRVDAMLAIAGALAEAG